MIHRAGQFNVEAYFVYLATCGGRGYVGASSILRGQTERAAVGVRKRHLRKFRLKWLEHDDLGSLDLQVVRSRLPKGAALIEEARWAAREYQSSLSKLVRGGPWCRLRLQPEDRREIKLVAAAATRYEVKEIAMRYPAGSLSYHLAGKSYGEPVEAPAEDALPATLGGNQKGPLVLLTRKRASGTSTRYKKGVQRASGNHRPGGRRASGKHRPGERRASGKHRPGVRRATGSQSSGSARRFSALPLS